MRLRRENEVTQTQCNYKLSNNLPPERASIQPVRIGLAGSEYLLDHILRADTVVLSLSPTWWTCATRKNAWTPSNVDCCVPLLSTCVFLGWGTMMDSSYPVASAGECVTVFSPFLPGTKRIRFTQEDNAIWKLIVEGDVRDGGSALTHRFEFFWSEICLESTTASTPSEVTVWYEKTSFDQLIRIPLGFVFTAFGLMAFWSLIFGPSKGRILGRENDR